MSLDQVIGNGVCMESSGLRAHSTVVIPISDGMV